MPPKLPPPTHFLCIPLVNSVSRPQLLQSISAFRADVTSYASFGVPDEAIRPVGTLHLTLGVMSFPKNEGLDRAAELLASLKPREILASFKPPVMPGVEQPQQQQAEGAGSEELVITLRGLESMQPPAKASVLYAPPVDPMGKLQAFGERLKEAFVEAELMNDDKRPLLLHATVLNTIYVRGGRDKKGKKRDKLTIDARGILDRYEDEVWMENVKVDRLAICKMGAKKVEMAGGEVDEEYEVVVETMI